MVVLSDLADQGAGLSVVDAGDVVHAARNEEHAVGRPGQVIDFRTHGAAHVLDTPCLLVFQSLFEVVVCLVLGEHPEQDVAIVAGAGQHVACTVLAKEAPP